MTRKSISHDPILRLPLTEKNQYEVAYAVKNSTQNTHILNALEQFPEIEKKMIDLILSHDEDEQEYRSILKKYPNFDYINLLYHKNAIMKNDGAKKKKHSHIISIRRATTFLILLRLGMKKHKYCYATTDRIMKILNKIGFDVKIRTIFGDLTYLESQGMIWRNRMSRAKKYGGGSTRHIITPCTAHQYRAAWLDKTNRFGGGKPQHVKDSFESYVSNLLFCTPSTKKKIYPPIYIYKYYINCPPRGKPAQKSKKKRKMREKKTRSNRKRPSKSEKMIPATLPAMPWSPDSLNDPEWVTREAVHQGCDPEIVGKLVDGYKIKQIPLKTNLLRAILHVAKSNDRRYMDAITGDPARERVLFGGEDALLSEIEDQFTPKFDISGYSALIESKTIKLDERKIECLRRRI